MVRELHPEAVSLSLRELGQPEPDPRRLAGFFGYLRTERIMTQVIFYDAGQVRQWQALQREGVIPPGPWLALFVLGRYRAGQTSSPADLLPYLQTWQAEESADPWAMCAFGAQDGCDADPQRGTRGATVPEGAAPPCSDRRNIRVDVQPGCWLAT